MRLLYIIVLLIPLTSWGQKEKQGEYGAHTTRYFTKEDIIYGNDTTGHYMDTTFTDVHIYEFNLKDNEWKQDLGNMGTAMHPLYFQSPEIGSRLGMNVYDDYIINNEKVRYYDARSPYSRLYYVQGFKGQQLFDFTFTRNINPRWNFGLDFQRMTSSFQYGALGEIRETSNYSFVGFTKYSSKDHRYQLIINAIKTDHSVIESGGINDTLSGNFYKADEAIPNMLNLDEKTPESSDNRVNYYLYHQYDLTGGGALNIYHSFERKKQKIRFRDYELENNLNFYGLEPKDSSSLDTRYSFENIDNTLGLKGTFGNVFYRAYMTYRFFEYTFDSLGWQNEQFYGGDLNYSFKDSVTWKNELTVSSNKEYAINSGFNFKQFSLEAGIKSYRPSLFQNTYYGHFESWNNDFVNTTTQKIGLSYLFSFGSQRLKAAYEYQNVNSLIYYNNDGNPTQQAVGEALTFNSFATTLLLKYKSLHFNNYTRFYGISGSDIWRAPSLFTKSSIYLDNQIFKTALKFKVGFDLYYKSGYKGYAYDPVIQQFYLQDDVTIADYPVLDVFMDFNIKVADLFLKMSHLNQGWWGQGYEATPGYVGTRRLFLFGIKWRFYN